MIDLSEDARTLLFVFRKGHGPEDPHAFVPIALALSFGWLKLFREPPTPLQNQPGPLETAPRSVDSRPAAH